MIKLNPHEQIVYEFLKNKKNDDIKSVLNIGLNCDLGKMHHKNFIEDILNDLGFSVKHTALEIYKPYAEVGHVKYKNYNFINGDVQNIDNFFDVKSFDLSVWWHGPEHIKEESLIPTIKKIENATKKIVILGSPEGFIEQGADGENIFDVHLSGPDSVFYKKLGYDATTVMDPVFLSCVAIKEFL